MELTLFLFIYFVIWVLLVEYNTEFYYFIHKSDYQTLS